MSSDNHVVDGHHQWLDRLQNAPDEPMPTLRIHAPARDILSQVHEFPSAGMEKAADVPGRTIASAQSGDTPAVTDARNFVADQRAAGKTPTLRDVIKGRDLTAAEGQRVLNDHAAAEAADAAAPATPSAVPSAPIERQPVTQAGKDAQLVLSRLAALEQKRGMLDGAQRDARRRLEVVLARDRNEQVLGPDAPPTTEAGRRAQQRLDTLAPDLGKMNAGQMVEVHGLRMAVENDRTAQRKSHRGTAGRSTGTGGNVTHG